ncbi:MAG: tetratricopeptide repeat protein, partial [Planctomycetes bacterium]|nr:tetratricopeptide repeat protein [Planctomycetota bacterium]
MTTRALFLSALLLAAAGAAEVPREQDAFQQLLQKVQTEPGKASEDQVKELIAAGQRLGHPYAVSLALKGYLVQAPHVSPGLLLLAAENALCAGDFRTATARCKAILDVPQGDGVAPEAAGLLCRVLVDFLGADDEAYRFLAANAEKFHQAPAVRRFDAWFLDTARRRRDWAGMARMLQLILAQGLPLEQERLHFWEHLDALMGEVVHANDDHLAALPFCRKLVPAIRDDRRRTLKYGLFVANLEFKAGSAGKEGASLDAAFEPVVAAARAYFAAYPTAATLRDIVHAFSDGGVSTYFNQAAWQRQAAAKSALFADAFGKLSDADHEAILEWRVPSGGHIVGLLASREQWAGLVVRHGDLFRRCDAARHIPLYMQGAPRELLKQQAAVVRDVPSRDAAVVNALAAVGGVSLPRERGAEPPPTSLAEAMEHLVRREAWHMAYAEPFELIEGQLWPAWRALSGAGVPPADPAGKMPAPPDTTYRQALARFGASVLARTPLALDSRAARACVEAAWDLGDAADGKDRSSKAAIIPLLDSLQWVPYSAKDRAYVFDTAHQRFRAWADWVRKEVTAKEPKATKAMADQIVPIEDAFRRVLAAKPDPAKAPDASCRALAEVLVAEEAKNQEAFLKAARTLYPLVRDSEAKRTPFGRAILTYLTRCRPQAFETIDFQAEALADQLALRVGRLVVGGGAHRQRWAPVPRARGTEPPPTGECALSSRILGEVAEACVSLTPDHGWWRAPAAYRERTLRLNALFEKALAEQLGRGQFSPQLFDWFRGTRSGEGWRDAERGEGLMAALIEKKALQQAGYRAHAAFRSATCSAQWIVRNEFPTLAARFAPERYFDDAFVEEGVFDPRYWDLGADSRRRVANAAAAFFAKLDTLPFGYGDGDAPAWSRADFWDWQSRALGADKPARDAMLARAEAAWGKSRFDTTAMGGGYFAAEAEKGPFSFSAQQPAAPQGGEKVHVPFSARKEFFTRLRPYLDKVRSAPARLGPPFFGALAKLEGKSLTKEEFDALLSIFPDCTPTTWPRGWGFEALPPLLTEAANALGRQAELFPLAPHFWKIARDTRNTQLQHDLAKAAVAFAAEAQELAVVWSQAGLDLMRAELSAEAASTLAAVRSKALAGVGGTIPVPRDDRRYPVYAAQADYLAGKTQSAWELAARNRAVLKTVVRELDPAFPLWLIGRSTELGDYDGAEDLARTMIQWFDSVSDGVPPETRARLLLAYANIAAARTDYPRARALYQRVVAAKEFEGTRAQGEAQIQIAETDRLTRRYDQAIEQLEAIARSKDPLVQAEAYYHIALVKFDQEEFREALKPLDEVFARVPDHALARILEGRTKIRIRKLEEPTELQIGTVAQRRFIVPGKPLVVNLEDRTLAALAESEAVEIRAWTDSGDEETFTLLPFADSKTKFRGHLPTALGAAAKGNGTLEVLGRDVVRYDYSAAFQKAHKTIVSSPQALEVVTEAELLVSSGVILSKEERAARALEALIKQRLEALEPTPRERPKPNVALSTVRPEDQVKPGNRINVRVVDGDQSVTAGKDKVTVSVAAASGDAIAAFPLEETGTHSGVFEGAVPTVPAQAVALASDSQDGVEPNAVIGPLAEKSPPWVGLPDGVRPKTFTIDLNDNIELGKMRVVA